jgi:hypothetical protein
LKYGLLCYQPTGNIGDEIQSLAARQFLPRVDFLIDRERMKSFQAPEQVKMISNGWYMCEPRQWPPSDSILPLLISIHISSDRPVTDAWFQPRNRDFLLKHGPIGARDTNTLAMLRQQGIPAYFSGCLTLTIRRNEKALREDYICAVDVSPRVLAHLREKTDRLIIPVTHWIPPYMESKDTFVFAEMLLDLYQRAHCVITSRLHVALPCLALQTPVLLLHGKEDQSRFAGLHDLVRHCQSTEYLNNEFFFDMDIPGENQKDYLALRQRLIECCSRFVGEEGNEAYAASSVHAYEGLLHLIAMWEKQKGFERALNALRRGRLCAFGAYLFGQVRDFFTKYNRSKRKK